MRTNELVITIQSELIAENQWLRNENKAQAVSIATLEAEVAALQPWVNVGKRAVREEWWQTHHAGEWKRVARCCDAIPPEPGEDDGWIHKSGCPISVLAQL